MIDPERNYSAPRLPEPEKRTVDGKEIVAALNWQAKGTVIVFGTLFLAGLALLLPLGVLLFFGARTFVLPIRILLSAAALCFVVSPFVCAVLAVASWLTFRKARSGSFTVRLAEVVATREWTKKENRGSRGGVRRVTYTTYTFDDGGKWTVRGEFLPENGTVHDRFWLVRIGENPRTKRVNLCYDARYYDLQAER